MGLQLAGSGIAQSESIWMQSKTRTRLKAYYEKTENDDKMISVNLIQGSGATLAGIGNVDIGIYSVDNDEETFLTNIITDNNGDAKLIIEKGYAIPKDENGYAYIVARFEGNDSLRASQRKVKFLDLDVSLSFEEEDTSRYVVVKAEWTDPEGSIVKVSDIDLIMGVERLYSVLPLEEATTEADGTVKIKFPKDVPGDSMGNVNVQIKINNDRKFGTITRSGVVTWGTPVDYSIPENGRSLYGKQAPLWMIIAVSVILAVVWIGFILAIFKVYKIKRFEQTDNGIHINQLN